ncbi:MAG: ABC transporter ATP-binding protein [Candidatus Binatia bacterium]
MDLIVDEGDFVVLLGPSGCGKSTLLRAIAGFEMPDAGEIVIGGQMVFSSQRGIMVPPGKRQVGMVFQNYALWPHMNVFDNVGFGLTVKRISVEDTHRRVDEVLRELSMASLGERYPSQLSGGQQQRVALARLLVTKPSVFLMDEPLSNLDARLRLDMRAEIKRIQRATGVTTLYVTHDQTEAMTMANEIAVINEGRIQQIGTPSEIYHRPANLFVAEFVGMPRINLLPAKKILNNGNAWLQTDDFRLPADWLPAQESVIATTRPEDVSILLEPEAGAIEFTVYAVQPTGPETFVHLRRGSRTIVARETRPIDFTMDQTVWLRIEPAAVNCYDEKSGCLLVRNGKAETETGSQTRRRS